MQVFIGPVQRRFKLIKTLYHLILPTNGEFENLCFVSVAPMVCVSRAFVYDAVNVNKIVLFLLPNRLHIHMHK